jgi:hypothetical protein
MDEQYLACRRLFLKMVRTIKDKAVGTSPEGS